MLNQKLYSAINIGGLTLGLACFLIIMLYVQHEFSFDRFYKNADHIYRVYQKQEGNVHEGSDYFAVTPAQLAFNMSDAFPEVVHATTVQRTFGLITVNNEHFWEGKGLSADAKFLNVFSLPFLKGDKTSALRDPKSFILTKSLASKIFGDQEPMGQVIEFRDQKDLIVTAIVDDPPVNSSIEYTFICSLLSNESYNREMKRAGWNGNSFYTFFTLTEGTSPALVEAKFPALIKKNQLPADYKDYPFKDNYFAEPITEMYFHQDINFDIGLKGSRQAIYIYSAVAIIVLLLACVNYTNLAVARSIRRSREVGIRKVVGALRKQITSQFLAESILIAIVSLLLAIALTSLLLPIFGKIVERPIAFNIMSNPWLVPSLFAIVILTGLLSGCFPALVMSAVLPIRALKAKASVKVSGLGLQRSLIVVQFLTSIALIMGSIVIYRQLNFLQQKDLGYNKKDIVTIRIMNPGKFDKLEVLTNEWLQNPSIINVAASTNLPTDINSSSLMNDLAGTVKDVAVYQATVNEHYIDVFGMQVVAGQNFTDQTKNSKEKICVLNETAVKALGWTPPEAVGKNFKRGDELFTVIGVVKDFHIHSLRLAIQPLMLTSLTHANNWFRYVSVKIKPDHIAETITLLEKSFKAVSPYPFQYQFLEDNYNQLYKSEEKLGEIFGFFTIVSIAIAALGLFGLAAFLAEQRTKEIGIRKVLGASAQNIVMLISKDFLRLVLIAFVLSIPIGWYAMKQWLEAFAYRITIEWWMFAFAGGLALILAKLAVGYQSIKAAVTNPVDSLRSE